MVVYRDGVAYTHGGVRPVIECIWCRGPTHMLGTKMCDRCYELQSRIYANPDLAKRMLAKLEEDMKNVG